MTTSSQPTTVDSQASTTPATLPLKSPLKQVTVPLNDQEKPVEASASTTEDVETLIEVGTQALALGNFSLASEKLSLASQIKSEKFGGKSREAAETLYLYGKALLGNAIQKNQVIGGGNVAGVASAAEQDEYQEEEEEVEDEIPADANASTVDQAPAEEEGIALDEIDEEDPDDLEIAWETFDLVRIIYTESTIDEDKAKLGEVHMALGDVSLESGNFDQAVTDFTTAVGLKAERLSPDDRELAEAHYKLALALEYSEQPEEASAQITKTVDVLKKHIAKLSETPEVSGKGKEAAAPATVEAQKEIDEINKLIEEMNAKLDDLRAILDKEAEGEAIAGEQTQEEDSNDASNTTSPAVNDVSGLVKKNVSPEKKRKTAEDVQEVEAKKVKI